MTDRNPIGASIKYFDRVYSFFSHSLPSPCALCSLLSAGQRHKTAQKNRPLVLMYRFLVHKRTVPLCPKNRPPVLRVLVSFVSLRFGQEGSDYDRRSAAQEGVVELGQKQGAA